MLKRFATVSVVSVMLASIWLTPAISAIVNADTVGGIGASRSATAGKLYPLNSARKFPNGVLYTGSGKGLDADKVDGRHGSTTPYRGKYLILNGSGKFPNSVLYTGSGKGLDADLLDGQNATAFVQQSSPSWAAVTKHLAVTPADWVIADQSTSPANGIFRGRYAYAVSGDTIMAPVHLPDGAIVTGLTLYCFDNDAAATIRVVLTGTDQTVQWWWGEDFETVSSDSSSAQKITTTGSLTIDNVNKDYILKAQNTGNGNKLIYSVGLTYTITAP